MALQGNPNSASGQLMTQEFAETVAFNVKENLPILKGGRLNQDLSNRLESGSGSVVSVLVPGVNQVTKGAATRIGNTDDQVVVNKVPVVVSQYNISAPYDLRDETLNFNTFESQISKPNAIKLASFVNKAVFQTVAGGACSAIADAANEQSATGFGFKELAKAIALVDSSRIGTTKSAMLHPSAVAAIIGNSANSANLFSSKGDKLYNGELGSYFDCECFSSPDAGTLRYATIPTFSAATLTFAPPNVSGASGQFQGTGEAVLTLTSASAVVLQALTPIRATNLNVYDAFGQIMGNRTLVVAANPATADGSWSLAAGTATPVRVWAKDASISGTAIPDSNAVADGFTVTAGTITLTGATVPLQANKTYALGCVFADRAAAFASIAPAPFPGTNDSVSTTLDGELNIRSSFYSDLDQGTIRWRFDILFGVSPLYGQGACLLYVPIA